MKNNHIIKPKLIRRKYKSIDLYCGGCDNKKEILYEWNDVGQSFHICLKCGRKNVFDIPK